MVPSKTIKRREKKKKSIPNVIETPRKSLLDVLNHKFKFAGRNTYVHRVIFIGNQVFSLKNLKFLIQQTVDNINGSYCDEFLTGIFLDYKTYFCHVLEGSEEAINNFFLRMNHNEEITMKIPHMKLLAVCHHIATRLLNRWIAINARPPSLLTHIDADCDVFDVRKRIIDCINKLYMLAYSVRRTEQLSSLTSDLSDIPEGEDEENNEIHQISQYSLPKVKSTVADFHTVNFGKKATSDCLPELQLLDFLLNNQHVGEFTHVLQGIGNVPDVATYDDKCWPMTVDFVPQHVYGDSDITKIHMVVPSSASIADENTIL